MTFRRTLGANVFGKGAGRPKKEVVTSVAIHLFNCAHCDRKMNNFKGGYSRGHNNELLCHPNEKNRPDCYKLVTLYKHSTPCISKTCYESHPNFTDYIKETPK